MNYHVEQICNGRWYQNCYLVVDPDSRQALVIDPGDEAERIQSQIDTQQLRLLAILNTHAHYDHVGAVATLQDRYGVPFYLHSKEVSLLKQANFYYKLLGHHASIRIPTVTVRLDEVGHPLQVGPFQIGVIAAPGHTPGGVCFQIRENLFTGDVLMPGKIGRVDLPGGDMAQLAQTLRTLMLMPEDMRVFPGHGEMTTIGQERGHNQALQEALHAY